MAGRNVNVWVHNWESTGQDVRTPQYALDVEVEWTDANGQPRAHLERVLFPNVLAQLPSAWAREALTELLLRALRKKLEIDEDQE